MVGLRRLELLTPRLSSVCSNQLSYRPDFELGPKLHLSFFAFEMNLLNEKAGFLIVLHNKL